MSEKPVSTLGFEKRFNPFLRIGSENEFVRELTSQLAPQPPNFKRIVELNRGSLLTRATSLEPLAAPRVLELIEEGATLLDGRDPLEFDGAHAPRSLNVTMEKAAVGTRAAWVIDPEEPVVVLAAGDDEARRMARLLEAVGFQGLRGYLAGGIAAWRETGLPIETTEAIDAAELARRIRTTEVTVLDVRDEDEWERGHVEGSLHVPYYELREGPPEEVMARTKPLAVVCSVGNRSSLAASLLRRAGVRDLVHVADGGVRDLREHGIELVRGSY